MYQKSRAVLGRSSNPQEPEEASAAPSGDNSIFSLLTFDVMCSATSNLLVPDLQGHCVLNEYTSEIFAWSGDARSWLLLGLHFHNLVMTPLDYMIPSMCVMVMVIHFADIDMAGGQRPRQRPS